MCLSATLYVVNMLLISMDATRGGRLVGAVVLLGPAWVAITFAGLLVSTLHARPMAACHPIFFDSLKGQKEMMRHEYIPLHHSACRDARKTRHAKRTVPLIWDAVFCCAADARTRRA